jgi:hypothetical protein
MIVMWVCLFRAIQHYRTRYDIQPTWMEETADFIFHIISACFGYALLVLGWVVIKEIIHLLS